MPFSLPAVLSQTMTESPEGVIATDGLTWESAVSELARNTPLAGCPVWL